MSLAGAIRPELFIVGSPLQLVAGLGSMLADEVMTPHASAPVRSDRDKSTSNATLTEEPSKSAGTSDETSNQNASHAVTNGQQTFQEDGLRVTPNGKKVIPGSVNQTLNETGSTVKDLSGAVDHAKNDFVRLLP
jgi:hypothetical protein